MPLYGVFDLDKTSSLCLLILLRMVEACTLTWNVQHPDQYWQGTQPAYNWVYGGVALPWEWHDEYRLRNTIYPAYLAVPLYALKQLGLDSKWAVLVQPYLTHSLLVIVGDIAIWKAGKKYVGKEATQVALILLLVSKVQTEYVVKCFTNAVEQILSVIAFYYFLEQRDRFTSKTAILTSTITLSFMMRNTSPIGWIPLLAIKVLREDSLVPFLIAGLFVAVPVIGLTIVIDTLYFLGAVDGEQWVLTSYNFLRRNILEGLSEYFGSDPASKYLLGFAPEIFTLVYPIVLIGCFTHVQRKWNQR